MAPTEEAITFGFFGGEPLLKFDLIRKVVAYIREQDHKNVASLHVTTNGTLITSDVLAYLKEEEIGLCISIDGPRDIHDRARRYRNGRSSFATVVDNLAKSLATLDKLQINAVYTPSTLHLLPETIRFFTDLGVPLIHINPDIQADWESIELTHLSEAYESVADYYIDSYLGGREIAVNQIDSKVIVFLKGGYDVSDRCGMAETEWGFAPSGNIYPCERFIGDDESTDYCMGNVHTGLLDKTRCQIIAERGNRNTECSRCPLQKYCMNWCGCTNYSMTGNTGLASRFLCASERASMRAAQRVLSSLKDNALFADHYYQYLVRDHIPLVMVT
jgi:uncharacterized protein